MSSNSNPFLNFMSSKSNPQPTLTTPSASASSSASVSKGVKIQNKNSKHITSTLIHETTPGSWIDQSFSETNSLSSSLSSLSNSRPPSPSLSPSVKSNTSHSTPSTHPSSSTRLPHMLPFPSSSSSTSPPKSSFPSFLYSHPTSIPSKSTSPTTTTTSNDEDTLTPTLTHPHGPHPTNPRSTTHPTTTTTTTTTPRPYPFVRSLIHWCSPIFWSVFLLHVLKTMVVYFVVLLKQEWQQYPLWPLVSPCTCTGLSLSLFTSKKGPKGGRSPVDVWKDTCVRYVRQPILYFKLHFHCLKQRMYLKCQQVDFHSVFVSWTSWMKQKSKFFL